MISTAVRYHFSCFSLTLRVHNNFAADKTENEFTFILCDAETKFIGEIINTRERKWHAHLRDVLECPPPAPRRHSNIGFCFFFFNRTNYFSFSVVHKQYIFGSFREETKMFVSTIERRNPTSNAHVELSKLLKFLHSLQPFSGVFFYCDMMMHYCWIWIFHCTLVFL